MDITQSVKAIVAKAISQGGRSKPGTTLIDSIYYQVWLELTQPSLATTGLRGYIAKEVSQLRPKPKSTTTTAVPATGTAVVASTSPLLCRVGTVLVPMRSKYPVKLGEQ